MRQRRNLYVSLLSALTTNLSPSLKICMEKFKVHGLTGVAESGGGVFFFFFSRPWECQSVFAGFMVWRVDDSKVAL